MSENTPSQGHVDHNRQIDFVDEVSEIRSEAPKVDLKSRRHPMTITFSNNSGFDPDRKDAIVVHLDSEWQPPQRAATQIWGIPQAQHHRSAVPQRTFTFRLSNGEFYVSDNFQDHSQSLIRTPLAELKVVKFSSEDENHDETNDFTIILSFDKPLSKTTGHFTLNFQNDTPKRARLNENALKIFHHKNSQLGRRIDHPTDEASRPWSTVEGDERALYQYPAVDWCSHVKIVVKDYKNPDKYQTTNRFRPEICQQILDQRDVQYSKTDPTHFFNLQNKAIIAESEASSAKLAALQKKKGTISAQVVGLPGFPGRYALRFTNLENAPWSVDDQNRGYLVPSSETTFFGSTEATYAPGQNDETKGCWQGVTFLNNRQVHISIENRLKNDHKASLAALAQEAMKGRDQGVIIDFWLRFVEDADESLTTRLRRANQHLLLLNQYQMGQTDKPTTPQFAFEYHQHFPNVFLHGSTDRSADRPIRHDSGKLERAFTNVDRFQLGEATHQDLIRKILAGKKGRYIGEGPPATGKTTAGAKIVGLLHECASLEGTGRIVVTAHTNEAVRVACARILSLMKQMFRQHDNEWDFVCLVIPQGVRNYWRMVGKKFEPRIEKAFLDSHLDRHAARSPEEFAMFIRGQKLIAQYGSLSFMTRDEENKYRAQRRSLIQTVKAIVRIWCATLSSIHHQDSIFAIQTPNGELAQPGMEPHVLIIDEASQATDVSIAMAMLSTNPRNVVFTGDDKQLSPFHSTPQGRKAWEVTMFGRLKARTPWSRLKKQYRTQKNLYAGTNNHYDNEVQTDSAVATRDAYHQILAAIRRISYQAAGSKAKSKLNNNVHVFDITNSTFEKTHAQSSRNDLEWKCMRGLMFALRKAGVPFDMMMALTTYQAQYDDMIADRPSFNGVSFRKGDSAQGDEADIVLFSMVRRRVPGFLTSVRRQNVVTSRARDAGFYFLDMDMIRFNNEMRASWGKWFNGLQSANPVGLVHAVRGPLIWGVDGEMVNPETAGSSPLTVLAPPTSAPARVPPPKPQSQGAQQARSAERRDTTTSRGSSGHYRQSSENDPNRGRAESASSTHSRAGSTSDPNKTRSDSMAREMSLRQRAMSGASGVRSPPTSSGQFLFPQVSSPGVKTPPTTSSQSPIPKPSTTRVKSPPASPAPASVAGAQSPLQQPRPAIQAAGLQKSMHAHQRQSSQVAPISSNQSQLPPNSDKVRIENAEQAKARMDWLRGFGTENFQKSERLKAVITQYNDSATADKRNALRVYNSHISSQANHLARQGDNPAKDGQAQQAIASLGEQMTTNIMVYQMATARNVESRKEYNDLKERWNLRD